MSGRYENNSTSLCLPHLNNRHSASVRSLFMDYMVHGDPNALIVHLNGCLVQHDDLVEHLLHNLSCTQVYGQQLLRTVNALKLLLQFGAKWNGRVLFQENRTPYHIISRCHGDHHELLDAMITSSEVNLLNVKDSMEFTAVMHAVHAGNIKCLQCLITHQADLDMGCDRWHSFYSTPLIDSIQLQYSNTPHIDRDVMRNIFDLLLSSGADINKPCNLGLSPIKHAVDNRSRYCTEKLIQMGARLDPTKDDGKPLWSLAVCSGNVVIHKYLIDTGFDRNCTDIWGRNALYFAISRGDYPTCRYLLEAGVALITPTQENFNQAVSLGYACQKPIAENRDPGMQAISMDMVHLVKLLEQYGCKTFQTMEALRYAMQRNSLSIVHHLLSTYNYPLNTEYMFLNSYDTILTEACKRNQQEMVALLMKHGADAAKQRDHISYQNAITIAISQREIEMVAHFIRSGANFDCRTYDNRYRYGLPFDCSIINRCIHMVEMLLYSGCSRGEFSLMNTDQLSDNVTPEIKKLMMDWEVHQNNVTPLQELCRKSILKHLYPAADKIHKLPLPPVVIKYLSIPELDDIVHSFNLVWPPYARQLLRNQLTILDQLRINRSRIIVTIT